MIDYAAQTAVYKIDNYFYDNFEGAGYVGFLAFWEKTINSTVPLSPPAYEENSMKAPSQRWSS